MRTYVTAHYQLACDGCGRTGKKDSLAVGEPSIGWAVLTLKTSGAGSEVEAFDLCERCVKDLRSKGLQANRPLDAEGGQNAKLNPAPSAV